MTAFAFEPATLTPPELDHEATPYEVIEEVRGMPAAPTGVGLSLRGVEKSFGSQPVLRGIDLDIAAGESVAIIGKSGCGKSTLLRLILGLETPSGGEIVWQDGASAAAGRFVFQEPRLLPWATVVDNVAVGLGRAGSKRSRRVAAERVLEEVGLGGRGGEWPSVLSGGQKQRVALARALVSHPRLLAFDEPLGALDALTRISMQGLIERVRRAEGFTSILVTHDVSEALTLADRVIVLEEGRVALDLAIDLPHPRRRGTPQFAALEQRVLDRLLGGVEPGEAI